jgi:DNA mismatch endonuclease (patch repair protein)
MTKPRHRDVKPAKPGKKIDELHPLSGIGKGPRPPPLADGKDWPSTRQERRRHQIGISACARLNWPASHRQKWDDGLMIPPARCERGRVTMPDRLSPTQRSYCMSRIRGRDTSPEIAVRSLIHQLGFRFRLHGSDLPGRPDIVLPRHRKVVFVNGCFWHVHTCRAGQIRPKSNASYWRRKRRGNIARDKRNVTALDKLGWDVLVVWECELMNRQLVLQKLSNFISARPR